MNCIITGGTGFIGTHLTNLIKAQYPNYKVWNLDIVKPGTPNPVVRNYKPAVRDGAILDSEYIECDVRKPIENIPFTPTTEDIIFNFAAVHRTPGHPDIEYFETNVRGAENVCAFAEKWGIRKIVFTSSIAPYGAAEELKEETTLPTPNTAYGISKLVSEHIHKTWQAKDAENRTLVIVRPGVVFGKGENGNFTRLYWSIRGRKFAYPGRKYTIKACIYVKELVRFMLYAVEHQEKGITLYNCCYEPSYTIEQIVSTMKNVTGLTQCVPYIPNSIIMPIATIAQACGSPMGICPARVKKLQISTNISGKKMANCGYSFKYTFVEALQDWFEDNDRIGLQ